MTIASPLASPLPRSGHYGSQPEVVYGNRDFRAPRLEDSEIHIWCVDLDDGATTEESNMALLSSDERVRANRLRFPALRRRFVAGRAAQRRILADYLDADPGGLRFRYGPFGKPCLESAWAKGIAFNATHSGSAMLVAIGRCKEIGVDLEKIRSEPTFVGLVARYFSDREQRILESLPRQRLAAAFFSIWTQKEALMKAMGSGLSMPLHSFDVMPSPGVVGQLTTRPDPFEADRWRVYTLDVFLDFACALAVSFAVQRISINSI